MATSNPYASRSGSYAGSGVAAGGQQGRSGAIHNGIGGTRAGGGIRPGATPAKTPRPRPSFRLPGTGPATKPLDHGFHRPAVPKPAAPAPAGGGFLKVYVNGQQKLMHRSKMTPGQLAAALKSPMNQAAGAAPATPMTPAPETPGTAAPVSSALTFKDSDYWNDFDAAQRDYRAQVDPMNAELAALQDRTKYGGKTLYDFMYEQAQSKWTDDLRATRDQQAKANLLRSGAGQRGLMDLDGQLRSTQTGLSDQYGAGRQSLLASQLANANAAWNDPGTGTLANIAKAAKARAVAAEQARIQATYGQSLDPASFQFADME